MYPSDALAGGATACMQHVMRSRFKAAAFAGGDYSLRGWRPVAEPPPQVGA